MTPKMQKTLEAIQRLTVDGVPPSFDELREDLGLANKSGVHRLLHGLRDHGIIDFLPGRARSIRIINPDLQGLALDKLALAASLVSRNKTNPTMRDFRQAFYRAVTQ